MSYVYGIIGAILAVLGIVIWKKQMVSIIAGYDKNKTKDNAGLAKWVGRNLMITGICLIILSIVFIIIANVQTAILMLLPLAILIIMCTLIAFGCKKFEY